MTLTIDLTPQEALRVEEAERMGFDLHALIRSMISALPPASSERTAATEYDATHSLFKQWAEEDADMTPEEIVQAEAEWEEFKVNINVSRSMCGQELMFP